MAASKAKTSKVLMVIKVYTRDYQKDIPKFLKRTVEEQFCKEGAHTKSEWDELYNKFMNKKVR